MERKKTTERPIRPTSRLPHVPEEPRRCHRCHSTGMAPCRICNGQGQVASGRDVNGHPQFTRCNGCMGSKSVRCPNCGGTGWL